MATTVNYTSNKLFTSGEIKFSQLRSNYISTDTNPINFSSYYSKQGGSSNIINMHGSIPTSGTIKTSNFRDSYNLAIHRDNLIFASFPGIDTTEPSNSSLENKVSTSNNATRYHNNSIYFDTNYNYGLSMTNSSPTSGNNREYIKLPTYNSIKSITIKYTLRDNFDTKPSWAYLFDARVGSGGTANSWIAILNGTTYNYGSLWNGSTTGYCYLNNSSTKIYPNSWYNSNRNILTLVFPNGISNQITLFARNSNEEGLYVYVEAILAYSDVLTGAEHITNYNALN